MVINSPLSGSNWLAMGGELNKRKSKIEFVKGKKLILINVVKPMKRMFSFMISY